MLCLGFLGEDCRCWGFIMSIPNKTETLSKQPRFNINQLNMKSQCLIANNLFCTKLAFPGEESQEKTGMNLT